MIWLVVAVAVAGGGARWFLHSRQATPRFLYTVASVERGTVEQTVTASGTLKPWSTVDIKSKAGGTVTQLGVEVGDRVRKSQVIARIDPADTLLTVRTAQADQSSSRAKQSQSVMQYQLQAQQTVLSVQDSLSGMEASRAAVDLAKARLKTAQDQASSQVGLTDTSIKAAEANYQNTVKSREQLDATQPQDRASAQSAYDQAVATDVKAKADLRRQQALLAKGFVSKQTSDSAEAAYKVAAAQVASASTRLRNLDLEQQTAREAADARVSQAKAQLGNARAGSADIQNKENSVKEARWTLRQTEMQLKQAITALSKSRANRANDDIARQNIATARADVARSDATLTNAQKTLNETIVRCPMSGVVLAKYVEQGTIITSGQSFNSTGTSIVEIGDTGRMYVDVSVDETDIAVIREKQTVRFTVDALKNVTFDGIVARISPQAELENNVTTYSVRVEVDNRNPMFARLRPGMNATCKFLAGRKTDVVVVPTEAVQAGDGGSYVSVATGGRPAQQPGAPAPSAMGSAPANGQLLDVHIERRSVKVGMSGSTTAEIVSGVNVGEMVVTQTTDLTATETTTEKAASTPFGGGGPPPGGPGGGGPGGGPSGGGGSHK